MSKIVNIVIAGVGGQGNIVVSRIIGECARISGLQVLVGEVFGASQRLGSVHSIVRIAEQEIYSPRIKNNTADLIIALEPIEALRVFREFGSNKTKVLLNTKIVAPIRVLQEKEDRLSLDEITDELKVKANTVEIINGTELALSEFNNARLMNTMLLAKACELGWLPFEFDVLKTALHQVFKGSNLEENLKALNYFSKDDSEELKDFSSYYKLMSGNKAIAFGAIADGVQYAFSYPGSPVTQIMEALIKHSEYLKNRESTKDNFPGLNASWSVNEMVAIQKAIAASLSGAKSMVVMKQNGLNIVADFLTTFAHTGLQKGSMVLVVGDDPGALTSTSSIDSRWILRSANIPVLTPSTPAEAELMVRWAFNLSELIQQIVVIRLTTRIAFQQSLVQIEHDAEDIHWSVHWDKIVQDSKDEKIPHYPESWNIDDIHAVNLPVLPQKREQMGKLKVAHNLSEKNMFNRVFGVKKSQHFDMLEQIRNEFRNDDNVLVDGVSNADKTEADTPDLAIVSTGIGFSIAYEAIDELGLWEKVRLIKVGFNDPLPKFFIHEHIADCEKVLIVEDTSPFIETEIRSLFTDSNKKWYGRLNNYIDEVDEITPDALINVLKTILFSQSLENVEEIVPGEDKFNEPVIKTLKPLPERDLSLCSGCPHKASFWVMKTVLEEIDRKFVITGDIGCYTLGCLDAGFNLLQTVNCMGSSIGMSAGFSEITKYTGDLSIAVIGDSTFLHAGLPGLIDSKISNSDVLLVILDNSYIAMTGGQDSATEFISIEKLLDALEIPYEISDPFDFKSSVVAFYDAMDENGTRCMIFRAPCALQSEKLGKLSSKEYYVDTEVCTYGNEDCPSLCTSSFACPAIEFNELIKKPEINLEVCKRCGFCVYVCKRDAIIEKKETDSNE